MIKNLIKKKIQIISKKLMTSVIRWVWLIKLIFFSHYFAISVIYDLIKKKIILKKNLILIKYTNYWSIANN